MKTTLFLPMREAEPDAIEISNWQILVDGPLSKFDGKNELALDVGRRISVHYDAQTLRN